MTEETPGELEALYLSVNATGLNVALVATLSTNDNAYLVYFDIDGTTSGLSSPSDAANYNKRPIPFTNGFKPDFFIGAWGAGSFGLFNTTAWVAGVGVTLGSVPGQIVYEAHISFSMLYPTGIPAGAQIGIVAIRSGYDNDPVLYDAIPLNNVVNTIDNHVVLPIDSNNDQIPDMINPVIGWAGNEADSSNAGIGVVGLPLDIAISVWSGIHDFPNASAFPVLNYQVYDNSTETWGTEMHETMYHHFGDYQGSNDWHRFSLPTGIYDNDDKINWSITTTYGTTAIHQVILGPMPPIDIGWVGGIDPSGGFILPDTDFSIVVQVEQLWEGTQQVTGDYNFVVELNYTIDDGVTWLTKLFAWDAAVGQNAQYRTTFVGGYPENTFMTFTIKITSNNDTETTAPIDLAILVPPPEVGIFYMTDPTGDEYGVYPTSSAFPPAETQLFDLLAFNVSSNVYVTTFHFRMQNVYDPGWGKGLWSHYIFTVMIDAVAGGATVAPGALYVNTDDAYPWDWAFQIDGWMQKYYTPATLDDPQSASTGITTAYEEVNGEYWFSFTVPKTLIGAVADDNWVYFVAAGSGDTNEYRAHNAVSEDWRFGGGQDGNIDPNYVDILVPAGGDSAAVQEYITESYDVATSTMATMLAVGEGLTFVEDTTDPSIAISSPADGTVYNIAEGASTVDVVLTWTAFDLSVGTFSGLDYIEVFVGSVLQVSIGEGTATLKLTAGTHTLRVNAYDKSGNYATDTITVTVNAAPEPEPKIPGYPLGFVLLASFAVIVYLIKKRT